MGSVEIAGGRTARVELIAAEPFAYALADGEEVSFLFTEPGFVYAPVAQNQSAGYAHVLVDGIAVGKIPLLYGETVEQLPAEKRSFWQKLLGGDN